MGVTVIVGAQWGDEGKGKITDLLAEGADVVVRYQGGSNAGHTVVAEGHRLKMHLIPSGILYPRVLCIMADGMVVDPEVLLEELRGLEERGISLTQRLRISRNAHVIFSYHRRLDQLEEERKGGAKIGTTLRGIGPAYADKSARWGLRMGDLCSPERLRGLLTERVRFYNRLFVQVYGAEPLPEEETVERYVEYGRRLEPFVANTTALLQRAYREGKRILFEGAQGTLLDLDYGSYPFVTSSHTVAAGACLGTGIPPQAVQEVIGVSKAYTTRVGSGPFPTELHDALGDHIREAGAEFGTTTGRPRRCGWLDGVLLRYAALVNGLTALAIMKLDVLSGLPTLRLAVAYECNGRRVPPEEVEVDQLHKYRPLYEELPGWEEPLGRCTRWASLPDAAKRYLERVESIVGVPIRWISVGPQREQTICR